MQKIENIPADQIIRIVEPSGSFSPGKPNFSVGSDEGVFLWKDTFDGPYHLRTNGSGDLTQFQVNLIATQEPLEVDSFDLEGNDQLEITDFGFNFNSRVRDRQDENEYQFDRRSSAWVFL